MPKRFGAALCGGNHRAAIARAEIDHVIFGRDFCHIEHFVHHRLRARHPHHILAFLAHARFELFLGGGRLCLSVDTGSHQRQETVNNKLGRQWDEFIFVLSKFRSLHR